MECESNFTASKASDSSDVSRDQLSLGPILKV